MSTKKGTLKRKIYSRLLEWKQNSNGETALMIDGARRVGKSYLCREFATKEYRSHIIIDFGNVSGEILNMFNNESDNLDLFFAKLSAYYGTALYNRESVIIFDEVQQFPRARQLIKYLVEDGRFDYIETGSLIRLKKNVQDIIIPSEEEHIEMFPLDFEEFLWALGDEVTAPLIKKCFDTLQPLGHALHQKIMNDFRQYMLVGGMPQSILAYLSEKNFEKSDIAKRRILQLYKDDVSKFAEGYEDKVFAIFDGIPGQLSKKEKKYKLSSLSKEARFRSYEDSFIWLNEAMIINTCYNATDPSIGLALSSDHTTQKCYMGDTGLLITQTFMDKPYAENELYKAILFDRLSINEGMIMENVVAQMLRRNGHRLYFYSRNDATNRANHMEIDFLITAGNKISPIEVKSGNYRFHSSLDKFKQKFSKKLANSYILYPKDVMIKDDIIHLPLYMAMFL
ncbi:putative AAA+ superfamily ATPase [Lachnospiraceae bacterium PF1-21]|uniref:AAA family ATPase n=1 Tax=Ohessyouella blattaphilus TaxID=2949333 RepID=A0ABT1EIR4_9FIRM|nr:AAA family ATPase [Ohessyouella blattaphilus]MCP1109662.1 AAA family ATPase [Ohessyouella blattaphilus]MCR8563056.1 AAA family ATPase [Ohessyouella blattaphilus]MDL2251140.1 AAA family ATPase [Lachnospiraceae bacterium OttesenSCG-928-J05]